jgi:hypothetical protein
LSPKKEKEKFRKEKVSAKLLEELFSEREKEKHNPRRKSNGDTEVDQKDKRWLDIGKRQETGANKNFKQKK